MTSGTASLETALFRVPQIVVYKSSTITYRIVRLVIRVTFISLVNLIAGREVVRELIQHDLTGENVFGRIRGDPESDKREAILSGYDEIINILDTGSASDNAGRLMVERICNREVGFAQRSLPKTTEPSCYACAMCDEVLSMHGQDPLDLLVVCKVHNRYDE